MPLSPRAQAGTHVGRRRANNQDSFVADDTIGLYAVADGVGGNAGGEVASREAVDAISDVVRRGLAASPALRGKRREDRELAARRLLEGALQAATYMVYGLAELDRGLKGMGTTVSALLVLADYAVIAQVGDSRVYQWRGGRARQLTEDHTLVAWQVREGLISAAEAERSPDRNVITRVIGCNDHVRVDTAAVEVRVGDRFLLCSDGLHGYLRPGELEGVMRRPPAEAVTSFVGLANGRGGRDNITAVVVDLLEGD
ncbi:MAG: protein phosphatase 2C domain-containing protein [Polyangiaceae bacterium]|jgi:serine/threonine protein phosphatase PrpC|nr:protein phosphatase 2C domain-containing protein [Polyangiaceae bacterium]